MKTIAGKTTIGAIRSIMRYRHAHVMCLECLADIRHFNDNDAGPQWDFQTYTPVRNNAVCYTCEEKTTVHDVDLLNHVEIDAYYNIRP